VAVHYPGTGTGHDQLPDLGGFTGQITWDYGVAPDSDMQQTQGAAYWNRQTGITATPGGAYGRWGSGNYDNNWEDRASTVPRNMAYFGAQNCTAVVQSYLAGNTEGGYDFFWYTLNNAAGGRVDAGGWSGNYTSSWQQLGINFGTGASLLHRQSSFGVRFYSDNTQTREGYNIDNFSVLLSPTNPGGSSDSFTNTGMSGWACDADNWNATVWIWVQFRRADGAFQSRMYPANGSRPDVQAANVCGNTTAAAQYHGYSVTWDADLLAWMGSGTINVDARRLDNASSATCGGTTALPFVRGTFIR
jgi:hypothetical protein